MAETKKKRLVIIHIVESFAGGVFDFIADLSKTMSEYQHIIIYGVRDHTPKNIHSYFTANVSLIEWEYATREISIIKDIQASVALFHLLKSHHGDIYHLHSSKAGFLGRIVARLFSKSHQTLYTPHGISFLRQDVSWMKRAMYIFLEKLGAIAGGTIVACSPSEQNAIKKQKIQCIMIANGIPEPIQKYPKEVTDKIIIGTCGRISHQKNPSLFNAIAAHYNNNLSITFVWIGDGELKNTLSSSNIRTTGWLSKEDVEYEMTQFDIYLSTSLWEGLPLTVITAMSLRQPLILSKCAGNVDMVQNYYNGYTFETLEDAINKIAILLKSEKKDIFGNNSYQIYHDNFTHSMMIDKYQNIYKSLSK